MPCAFEELYFADFSGRDVVPMGLAEEAKGDLEDGASVGSGLEL